MIELNPKSPGNNGTSDTDGAYGTTVTTLHPQISHTTQRVRGAMVEGIDRLASVLSTTLTRFDRRTRQLKNLHVNISEQVSDSVHRHPVITVDLTFMAGMLLEQLTQD